jgi:hypothetical protein
MKSIVIGAHLLREDVVPVAEALPCGELHLSALAVPDDQPLGDRDLLVRVAGIRAELLQKATFVAIRYGFAVSAAEEAQAKCAPHLARWKRLLTANRGHVEMTLKVAASGGTPRPDRREFSSGAAYLRALHASRQSANVPEAFREAAERLIGGASVRWKWQHRDERSVELCALVARERLEEMHAAGETLKRECADVAFLLSGPWPLEAFADDDHE